MKALNSFFLLFMLFPIITTCAQNSEAIIKTHQLTESIYMLEGQGGNIGISVGNDGILMIDSQFAPLTPKILESVRALSDKPIQYLANTHHHHDHTGGNENIHNEGAKIIGHDNVYGRIKANEGQNEHYLPTITFNDKLNLHFNGDQIIIFHVDNAHTDGDALLYFMNSNVLHTGDVFFNGRYPYIDLNSGGSVDGYIDAVKSTLMLIDEETKVIPGHGNMSNKSEYEAFLVMLQDLKQIVLKELKSGKTEDEVASNTSLTKTYDDLGFSWNFITSEKIRRTFYKSLKE